MNDVVGRIGKWGSSLILALALGCSSQAAPDSASGGSSGSSTASGGTTGGATGGTAGTAGDAGTNCSLTTIAVMISPGSAACSIQVALPTSAPGPENVLIRDQSGTTIPYSNVDGWSYGDPQTPLILVGSYCADAMAGKITALTIIVGCVGHPVP